MAASSSSGAPLFGIREEDQNQQMNKQQHSSTTPTSSTAAPAAPTQKKKRNQPGTPSKTDPEAEVIALSPKTLMATNRFICEVCNKGFQREQNLQLHRRGHNLPWKLKQKTTKEPKRKVYLCPEPTCVHHDPSRALGDLTGIKKHYSRKHGEKKWKCEKCSKRYAVQSDWKAHSKTCGTREYRCDCGTLFSRRDSFITHRAFCDALAQESARHPPSLSTIGSSLYGGGSLSNTGLGLSHQVVGPPHQLSSLDHNNQSSLLRLGGSSGADAAARTGQFDHLLSSPSMGSSFRSAQSSAASFFMTGASDHDQSNQQQYHDQDNSFHGLMQFQSPHQHHSGGGANIFNLPFLSNSTTNNTNSYSPNNNNNLLISPDHFNTNANGSTTGGGSDVSNNLFTGHIMGGGDHMSSGVPSPYSNNGNSQQQAMSSHMSATALLQKAAQMGSTTSNNTTTASLLRSFGSSSSTTTKPDRLGTLVPSSLGGMFGSDQTDQSHLQDLMNSFASGGGGSSIFGNTAFGGYDASENRAISMEDTKLQQQNIGLSNIGGGSDRLTRDFLGVGQVVRSMSGGFSHQRSEQQHGGVEMMSSLDSESNAAAAAPSTQSFGGGGNFQ
ncbi:hypothetical protein C1H46_042519 [Malus baccata]|uniref:C2H2-type domain-containing protein n=1 Tax=Malus baccata TaxID=106549 RepID=A0A540KCK2_MALBA|nr:hypothetical protein C1H46_042519 [Malus baccata]